jgi:hypothetical protein
MSDPIDTGGPAFPLQGFTTASGHTEWPIFGMTLRDYFAGQALAGVLANCGGPIQANGMSGWGFVNCEGKDVAQCAYEIAGAMIAARNGGAA